MVWTYQQLRMMIDERKNANYYFHDLHEGRKSIWWKSLASRINLSFETSYSRKQVNEKFQDLVRDHTVSIKILKHHHRFIYYESV